MSHMKYEQEQECSMLIIPILKKEWGWAPGIQLHITDWFVKMIFNNINPIALSDKSPERVTQSYKSFVTLKICQLHFFLEQLERFTYHFQSNFIRQ